MILPASAAYKVSCALIMCLLMLFMGKISDAQTYQTNPMDGSTPLGLSSGTPAGSYALSEFDTINLFNGRLNFQLPIFAVTGRGDAQMNMVLALDSPTWTVTHGRIKNLQTGEVTTNLYTPQASDYEYSWRRGYGPGEMKGRSSGTHWWDHECMGEGGPAYDLTLTRLTFNNSAGTQYELRDQLSNGKPYRPQCSPLLTSRGQVFITADGSSATFTSDSIINDARISSVAYAKFNPSGNLMTREGDKYRIINGKVIWMRDRNGNKLIFTYEGDPSSGIYGNLLTITDSLNRQVTIDYNVNEGTPYGTCDKITYKGFGGSVRVVRISYTNLANVLRPDFALATTAQLFPTLNGASPYSFNPVVASALWLPDGRSYRFYYNNYGELARVELPTGGAFEYDYTPDSGVFEYSSPDPIPLQPTEVNRERGVYRRLIERRIYNDGATLEGRTLYTPGESVITVDHLDSENNFLAGEQHHYYGSARASITQGPVEYPKWKDGREWKTEWFGPDATTAVKRLEQTWEQRAPISWWSQLYSSPESEYAPPNDPRLTENKITLLDSNQVAKQTFGYDQYNNQTDIYEYDYNSGSAGALLRRKHADYLTVNPIGGSAYDTDSSIHLKSLPTQQQIFDGSGNERARTTYEYDNYNPADGKHAALLSRTNVSGLDPEFTISRQSRGNLTRVSQWLFGTTNREIKSYSQYDMVGNVVKKINADNYQTLIGFSDHYGSPDGEARANTVPAELNGQASFAFPSQITNALGYVSYTQYDYYLGKPIDSEDPNGVKSSGYYDDLLDRPTKLIDAGGTTASSQTRYFYDDYNRTITTVRDKDSFGQSENINGGGIKSAVKYDGLGRTWRTGTYEGVPSGGGTATWIIKDSEFDAMSRVHRVSNPYRANDITGAINPPGEWNTTVYDTLGRAIQMTMPDGSVSTTSYYGNAETNMDQALKQRRLIRDGMGRLIRVDEPDGYNNLGGIASPIQPTSYIYSALNNLVQVNQGSQVRTFGYDSLGRLTRAYNPESNTIDSTYTDSGDLETLTNVEKNVIKILSYDALHRIRTIGYSDGTTPSITYEYDGSAALNQIGRLTSVSSSISTYTYDEYDPMGRVLRSAQNTGASGAHQFAYSYNLAGGMKTETYPSGMIVVTDYDTAGRTNGLSNNRSITYVSSVSYAAHNMIKSFVMGNGLWEHTISNNRLQPSAIGLGASAIDSSVWRITLGYGTSDNNGNIRNQIVTVPGHTWSQSYEYDFLNRLSHADEAESGTLWVQTYGYDRYGNRWVTPDSYVPPAGLPLTPRYVSNFNPSNNRLENGCSTCFDFTGNLTMDVAGNRYDYDAENRQIRYNNGAVQYFYDGDGRRVKKIQGSETTVFVYDAMGRLAAEYSSSIPQGIGGISYLTQDHLGSTRVLTNSDGNVTSRRDYLPFGEEIPAPLGGRDAVVGYSSNNDIRQLFTGKERDAETGLDYFGARYYSGAQGRYTIPDWSSMPTPVPYADFKNPQSLNLYSYVGNNPLTRRDANGHCWPAFICAQKAIQRIDNSLRTAEAKATATGNPGIAAVVTFAANVIGNTAKMAISPLTVGQATGTCMGGNGCSGGQWAKAVVGDTLKAAAIAAPLASAGLKAAGALQGGATATSETTSLFRAVMPNEAQSIRSAGAFSNPAGIESKYFSTSLEGAQSYASQAAGAFGDGPFSFVSSSIPTSAITPGMTVTVDGGIKTVVVGTQELNKLTAPIFIDIPK
jgi:RHS repeat-associated protein